MKKVQKPFFVQVYTMYDGLNFSDYLLVRAKDMTDAQLKAGKQAEEFIVHADTGEELDYMYAKEISEEEYAVLSRSFENYGSRKMGFVHESNTVEE